MANNRDSGCPVGASLYPQSWTRARADLGGVCSPCRSFCLSSLAHVSDLINLRSSASMRKPRDRERERNESKDGPRVTRHRGLSRAPLFQPRRMPARAHGAAERGVRGRRDRGPAPTGRQPGFGRSLWHPDLMSLRDLCFLVQNAFEIVCDSGASAPVII